RCVSPPCSASSDATTHLYALSLHDALPISGVCLRHFPQEVAGRVAGKRLDDDVAGLAWRRHIRPVYELDLADGLVRQRGIGFRRSEEHTSELQSRENLVCRLLLEKKKPQRV